MSRDDTRPETDYYTPEVRSPLYDDPDEDPVSRRARGYEDRDYGYGRYPRKSKSRSLWRVLRGAALVVFGGVVVVVGAYLWPAIRTGNVGASFATSSPAPAGSASKPAVPPVAIAESNLIGKQAQAWGLTTCLAPIASAADDLTRNTTYNYHLKRGQQHPDEEMVSGTIAAREPTTGISGISSFYAQPTADGRCDIASQTTLYFDEPCTQVRQARFPGFTTELDFGQIAAAYATANGRQNLYLLPAGTSGCLAVSTGAAY